MSNIFDSFEYIDLTHTLDKSVPTWYGEQGFHQSIDMDYDQGFCIKSYSMEAGIGTHMDSPQHFIKGALDIGTIKLQDLIVPAYVIDIRAKVKSNDDYKLTVDDITDFEKQYGQIQEKTLFLVFTGWSLRWPDVEKYRNPDKDGNMHFPGFSVDAGRYLLEKNVVGVGIDVFSVDGSNFNFPFHKIFLGAGKYVLENVANLDKMPPAGAYVIAFPLKIKNGTESPARVVGLVPKE